MSPRPGAMVASAAPGIIRESRPGAMVASTAPGIIRDRCPLARPGALVASTAPGIIRECSWARSVFLWGTGDGLCSVFGEPPCASTRDLLMIFAFASDTGRVPAKAFR